MRWGRLLLSVAGVFTALVSADAETGAETFKYEVSVVAGELAITSVL
jgi:hypothetical protein